MLLRRLAKRLVAHHAGKDLLVAVHAIDEQAVKHLAEPRREVVEAVGLRRLHDLFARGGSRADLIEEQLIRLGKVGTEALVELSTRLDSGTTSSW